MAEDEVEKGSASIADLRNARIDLASIEVIDILTQRRRPSRRLHRRCRQRPVASIIKRADLIDKLDPERLGRLRAGDADLLRQRVNTELAALDTPLASEG